MNRILMALVLLCGLSGLTYANNTKFKNQIYCVSESREIPTRGLKSLDWLNEKIDRLDEIHPEYTATVTPVGFNEGALCVNVQTPEVK